MSIKYPSDEQMKWIERPGEGGTWLAGVAAPVGAGYTADLYGPCDKGTAMRVRRLLATLNPYARTWIERIPDEELAD